MWRYTGNSSDPNQRALVPLPGHALAEYYGTTTSTTSTGMAFDYPDALGSLVTSVLYSGHGNGCNDRLYYPFGEFWTGVGNCGWGITGTNTPSGNMHQTFAQLPDYDPEIDLYNTLNRHYNGNSGRWMSPDPAGLAVADPSDPQTWNMYAYVRNEPTTNTDPTGEACVQDAKGNWVNDNSGGQTCEEAFSPEQNNTPSVTVTASVSDVSLLTAPFINTGLIIGQQFQTAGQYIYDSARLGYIGFVNAFINGHPLGLAQLALAIAALLPGGGDIDAIAGAIAGGHAFDKHIGEMAALGVASKQDLKALVKETMENATGANIKQLAGGRVAYWNDSKNVVVIYNPNAIDKGTVFVSWDAKAVLNRLQ